MQLPLDEIDKALDRATEKFRDLSMTNPGSVAFHELADIFPLLDAGQIRALADDIVAGGQREPITLFEGKILDGRCRYLALNRAGIQPEFENYTGKEPVEFVVSRNLYRRHLNDAQRAMVAAKIAKLKPGANGFSDGLPIGSAALIFNVSARSVARAKLLLRAGDAALVANVESGVIALSAAAEIVKERATLRIISVPASTSDAADQITITAATLVRAATCGIGPAEFRQPSRLRQAQWAVH